ETVRTHEFHEGKERLYRAVPMARLLRAVYGDAWKKADEILFTCADGYQPSIPVVKFLQHPGYLAVARADQERFTLVNKLQNHQLVALVPSPLVGDTRTPPALKNGGASPQPYQVVGLDLIDFATKSPGMAPPAGASAQARRGFLAF